MSLPIFDRLVDVLTHRGGRDRGRAYALTLKCDISEETTLTTGPVLCVPQPDFLDIELRHALEVAGVELDQHDHFRVDPAHPGTGSLTVVTVLDDDEAAVELVDTLSLLCSRRTFIAIDEVRRREERRDGTVDDHQPLHFAKKGRP